MGYRQLNDRFENYYLGLVQVLKELYPGLVLRNWRVEEEEGQTEHC